MPNIGPMELIVVLVIALLVLGPKRLPGLGKQLGTGMRDFKEAVSGNGRDDDDEDDAPQLAAPRATEPLPTAEPGVTEPVAVADPAAPPASKTSS